MKKVLSTAAALSLVASVAFAGGPVVVVEEGQPVAVEAGKPRTGAILPIVAAVVLICAVACGGDGT